ncbi:hypothetical protein SGLAM104S_05313 [Streptomyces glaucescens]
MSRSERELLRILELNRVESEERARRTTSHWKLPDAAHERTLLSVQRGMYLQSRIDALGHTYTIPLFVELTGTDADAAERSVRALLAAEPILRMRVRDDLSYEVLPADAFTVARTGVTADRLDALREDRARTAFPLPDGRLIRPEVVEVQGTGTVVVCLTHHHMLSDASSAELLVHRLLTLHGTPDGGASGDDGPALDYFDLVAQQRIELAPSAPPPATGSRAASPPPASRGSGGAPHGVPTTGRPPSAAPSTRTPTGRSPSWPPGTG